MARAALVLLVARLCSSSYVSYTPGDVNLILTVPHNGYDKPDIPTRQPGCEDSAGVCRFPGRGSCSKKDVCKVATLGDAHTQRIGKDVFSAFVRLTGRTPHLIISNIHRSKMDPNREKEDATQGNSQAVFAYNEYHNTITQAKNSFGGLPGLVIDIHGQSHDKNTTELGYLIKKAALNSGNYDNSELSIKALVRRENADLDDYIYGRKSLGALFEDAGYKAVPSPRQPSPGTDLYYRGGYTTQVHGSRDGGQVDAIQVEIPGEIRIEGGKKLRKQFSTSLANILEKFFSANYETLLYY